MIFYCEKVKCSWQIKRNKLGKGTEYSETRWFTWVSDQYKEDIAEDLIENGKLPMLGIKQQDLPYIRKFKAIPQGHVTLLSE